VAGGRVVRADIGPVQSRELALATSSMRDKDIARMTDADIYFTSAYRWMRFSLKTLKEVGFQLRAGDTVLEFGCGSARLLRLLRSVPDLHLIGTDMNPVCVDWCRENIPGADYYRNEKTPPLAFAQDKSIDLIFACSVFTHISLDLQKSWLRELYRILRPGGIFLCTVLGRSYVENMLGDSELEGFKRNGYFQMRPDHHRVSLSSRQTGQDDIFQTRDHIFESFGSVFHIIKYLERGVRLQNLLVLQRPEHTHAHPRNSVS